MGMEAASLQTASPGGSAMVVEVEDDERLGRTFILGSLSQFPWPNSIQIFKNPPFVPPTPTLRAQYICPKIRQVASCGYTTFASLSSYRHATRTRCCATSPSEQLNSNKLNVEKLNEHATAQKISQRHRTDACFIARSRYYLPQSLRPSICLTLALSWSIPSESESPLTQR